MNDFDLLTDDEYRQLVKVLGGQELFVAKNNPTLAQILGDKADDFIRRFRGDRIYIKKHALEQIRKRQLDYIYAVKDKCQKGESISVAIKQSATAFGISERWGYELYARFKGGKLVKNGNQLSLF